MDEKKLVIDVDGSNAVTNVLLTLLNQFDDLNGKTIKFSTLNETSGIGFFPTSGAVLLSNTEDITGHVHQICMYPFDIIYRSAPKTESHRIRIKELLDDLGHWLEQISTFPTMNSGMREIKSITRTSASHLTAAYQDGIEDWRISLSLRYENEFDK